jgi:predicted dehydrogenase
MNLGILGCSDICTKSIFPHLVTNDTVNVLAVASRDKDRALDYSNKYNIKYIFDSYYELLNSNYVDSVYIALPPVLHAEQIINAIRNNKNVLVEKPICTSIDQFNDIENTFLSKNMVVLEGIMTQHHPWEAALREIIVTKKFGRLKKLATNICMKIPSKMKDGYRYNKKLGGSIFYDEGPYWLQFIQYCLNLDFDYYSVLQYKKNENVETSIRISARIKDTEIEFYSSYEDSYAADHILFFEKAILCVKNFFRASLGKYKIRIAIESADENGELIFPPQNYYDNQLKYFLAMTENKNCNLARECFAKSKERILWLDRIYKDIEV